jgi:hypothetical protein
MTQMDSEPCDLCGQAMPPHTHYVVRIDVYADPALPPTTSAELNKIDFDNTFDKLLKEMKELTAEELADQVHRRFEFKICPACQKRFLSNPLGKPRNVTAAKN